MLGLFLALVLQLLPFPVVQPDPQNFATGPTGFERIETRHHPGTGPQ